MTGREKCFAGVRGFAAARLASELAIVTVFCFTNSRLKQILFEGREAFSLQFSNGKIEDKYKLLLHFLE